jgi:hypothetical protein
MFWTMSAANVASNAIGAAPKLRYTKGVFHKYAVTVSNASEGAITDQDGRGAALEISARGASTIGGFWGAVDWKYIKWRFVDETAERKS